MAVLEYAVVADGRVLDQIDVADGVVVYLTGAAHPVIEGLARAMETDELSMVDRLVDGGWSNGYVSILQPGRNLPPTAPSWARQVADRFGGG